MNYTLQIEAAGSPERLVHICKNYTSLLAAENYFSKQWEYQISWNTKIRKIYLFLSFISK